MTKAGIWGGGGQWALSLGPCLAPRLLGSSSAEQKIFYWPLAPVSKTLPTPPPA